MEPHQFSAIYEEAPECLQIMMDIILQTSLRQIDIRKMQWGDIENDTLYVIDSKSRTNKRNDSRATFLKFNLEKNPKLRDAINRARQVKLKMQGKREEFKDCPFVLINTEIRRVNKNCTTKEHPLQMTKREAGKILKKVRDQIAGNNKSKNGKPVFYDWTAEEMPAYHGIRKLSLQTLEDQGIGIDDLSMRAGHKDQETTQDIYLDRNHSAWKDSTFQVVDTKNWKPGDHKIDELLKRAG